MSCEWRITVVLGILSSFVAPGQTTQGLISGRVVDRISGTPVANASVEYRNYSTGAEGQLRSDSSGNYTIPLLSPGIYKLIVTAPGFQTQQLRNLDLPVAARLDVPFRLRPLADVWESGQFRSVFFPNSEALVTFYGPDVDTSRSGSFNAPPHFQSVLESSVSYSVDPDLIRNLPLAGRDVYTLVALMPGVTADASTARGLGVSVNGQRPVSSNFLLDGVENNNNLVTGPLTSLPPEMIGEYRVSTSSWSAEYGRTAGVLANGVTQSGGQAWHGAGYFNLKNDVLNANTFQNNAGFLPKSPFKENQYGFDAGGPAWKQTLFVFAGFENYTSRSYQPAVDVTVPSPEFVLDVPATNLSRKLLTQFPTPATDPGDGIVSTIKVRPTVSFDRHIGLGRADYVSGPRRIYIRGSFNRFEHPDFIWYPYKDFISGLTQPADAIAAGYAESVRPALTHEARAGWSRTTLGWDRAHPEIPTLEIADNPAPLLPGSPAAYGLRDSSRAFQFDDNWLWVRGRHVIKAGGGLLFRNVDGAMTTARDGRFSFSLGGFLFDLPDSFTAAISRATLPQFQQPSFDRTWRNRQYFFFAGDSWRASRHLVINAGLRYENVGAPVNTGAVKDATLQLGPGASFPQRIASAQIVYASAGDQPLWTSDRAGFAPRIGVAWDGLGSRGPVVRGGYGIFFDRPFDNLWENVRNNSLVVPPLLSCISKDGTRDLCTQEPASYLAPTAKILSALQGTAFVPDFPSLTVIDPHLRNGYAQSFFLGLEKRFSDAWDVELQTLGSLGRRLITTDTVNRAGTPQGRYNPQLFDLLWRSSQGSANYNALVAAAHYRSRHGFLQVSYTWSHSIDNQSDPLAGDFFDLSFVNFTKRAPQQPKASFSRQFDSSADRASSSFDQRHNLVFFSWWELPRGFRISQLAAIRSGFPYSVLIGSGNGLINQRADLIRPDRIAAPAGTRAEPGSVALLNRAAFAVPPAGVQGNTGRNAFGGPGLWSTDVSISREFGLRPLGEAGRITARADFFNLLNHANLNNPDSVLGSATFGQAAFGRLGYDTGFPALVPFNETARQIQLIVKVEF